MKEKRRSGQTKEPYLYDLSKLVLRNEEGAQRALGELSKMAMLGDSDAQEAVRRIDSLVEDGSLTLPLPQPKKRRTSLGTFLRTAFGGVSEDCWSQGAREGLKKGKPLGGRHPEHRDA